ncbi:MAG: hypothetical protein K0V04_12515 [Deltaproteobacteria bacterium]|nr:hypothetical protein [Deltaproteobacteria bacterium]
MGRAGHVSRLRVWTFGPARGSIEAAVSRSSTGALAIVPSLTAWREALAGQSAGRGPLCPVDAQAPLASLMAWRYRDDAV